MSLPYDPLHAIATLSQADARLAALIERAGPFRLQLENTDNPFLTLLDAIVSQQLSGKAAATIYRRICALFPAELPTPAVLLELPEDALRGAGLSQAKTRAVRDLADKTLSGLVPTAAELLTLDDEAIVQRLIAVRGIGRWTVEMLLIFHLGRPDVLPVDDLGVRKGFMLTYDLPTMPTPKALRAHGERWRPYRSVASWYFWRALDK